ncbi:MAG: hypothetical protein AAGF30_10420 [Pseudomonadota bacterium]
MFRSFLAATLSVALALPAVTAPAHANPDAEDIAKVLGGLAALYVLSRALENRNVQNNRVIAPVRRAPVYTAPTRHRDLNRGRIHHPRDRFDRNVRIIPDSCYREVDTRRGVVAGYGARCMQNRVARPGILPPQCIRQVQTVRGPRNLYSPRCLRQQGWSPRTARR